MHNAAVDTRVRSLKRNRQPVLNNANSRQNNAMYDLIDSSDHILSKTTDQTNTRKNAHILNKAIQSDHYREMLKLLQKSQPNINHFGTSLHPLLTDQRQDLYAQNNNYTIANKTYNQSPREKIFPSMPVARKVQLGSRALFPEARSLNHLETKAEIEGQDIHASLLNLSQRGT